MELVRDWDREPDDFVLGFVEDFVDTDDFDREPEECVLRVRDGGHVLEDLVEGCFEDLDRLDGCFEDLDRLDGCFEEDASDMC